MNAIVMIGNTIRIITGNGSRRMSRTSCARIAPSRRSDIRRPPRSSGSYRRPVTARYTDSRLGRSISIDRSAPASRPSAGSSCAARAAGSVGGDANGRSVDDRARDTRRRRHRAVERQLERARAVPVDELGQRPAGDDVPWSRNATSAPSVSIFVEVVRRVDDRRPSTAPARGRGRGSGCACARRHRSSVRRAGPARGRCSSAMAVWSRRRSPPESCAARRSSKCSSPSAAATSSMRVRPRRGAGRRGRRRSAGCRARAASGTRRCPAVRRRAAAAHPAWRPHRRRSRRPRTRPASGRRSPATIDTSVVLPAPLGPSSPRMLPGSTRRSTPASATFDPYDLRSPSTRSAGASGRAVRL